MNNIRGGKTIHSFSEIMKYYLEKGTIEIDDTEYVTKVEIAKSNDGSYRKSFMDKFMEVE